MKKFVLIGAAGYIAPKHMKAIKETGNDLLAAFDPVDSVGIIDSFFPKADFFTEFERFDRYIDKLRRSGTEIDFVSVCSPNYLHDAHVRFGLRLGANVICEKPLVLNPWNIDALEKLELESEASIYNILQLRNHESILQLKNMIENKPPEEIHDVELTYQTSRGNWYYASWKGDIEKSGGIATNIGIHFFDILIWLFGPVLRNTVHLHEHDRAAGFLELRNARVKWFLSINEETLPVAVKESGKRSFRSIKVNGEEIEFSDGFTELHTIAYRQILSGEGFDLATVRPSIELVHQIRNESPARPMENAHELALIPVQDHPFKR